MLTDLQQNTVKALEKLNAPELQKQLAGFEAQMADPDFWSDSTKAQKVSKEHAALKNRLEPWLELQSEVNDLVELKELGEDVSKQAEKARERYEKLAVLLKYDGTYDTHDAIITIQSGAGGTDAQDWAQMLERMYLRWAEKSGLKSELLSEAAGEEAGIKSATLQISGDTYTYGKLRGEHGVHRLVLMSPFNSGGTRETSFAMVEVMPLIDEPSDIELDESELKIDTFRAGGNGGQSVNTTDSAVRITHVPTGVSVSMQNEKSQLQNKAAAMKILASRLAQLKEEQHLEKLADLRGPNQDAAWGNQIRNYVLHPYKLVKNTDGSFESSDVEGVLDGALDPLL